MVKEEVFFLYRLSYTSKYLAISAIVLVATCTLGDTPNLRQLAGISLIIQDVLLVLCPCMHGARFRFYQ